MPIDVLAGQAAAGVADGTGPLLLHVGGSSTAGATVGGSIVGGSTVAGVATAGTAATTTAGAAVAKGAAASHLAALGAVGGTVLGALLIGTAAVCAGYLGYRAAKYLTKGKSKPTAERKSVQATPAPSAAKSRKAPAPVSNGA